MGAPKGKTDNPAQPSALANGKAPGATISTTELRDSVQGQKRVEFEKAAFEANGSASGPRRGESLETGAESQIDMSRDGTSSDCISRPEFGKVRDNEPAAVLNGEGPGLAVTEGVRQTLANGVETESKDGNNRDEGSETRNESRSENENRNRDGSGNRELVSDGLLEGPVSGGGQRIRLRIQACPKTLEPFFTDSIPDVDVGMVSFQGITTFSIMVGAR